MPSRKHGEAAAAQAAWDEAVEQALRSPDIPELRAALWEAPIGRQLDRDEQREAAHLKVVRFV